MLLRLPLTLTLSPSDGAREKNFANVLDPLFGECSCDITIPSLAPSDGERVRVRGSDNGIAAAWEVDFSYETNLSQNIL
jgi:hypothetical protein